ncbi:signal peptide peptidase SppA [Aggregicoccus sp. 17bor-14]|uniref:signal peptide peptidase SppA n=1 Tax=Myxococcaceae TaxID=31 RepID=UPI00129C183C|nr:MULTISPECIES: signal peptide peptidase SppA [Myxococcaceae]MBF5040910.1 signal peptide peptidase SppA [Simulacricoccus sp. 17bor-14]MRI86698.1 signal peptide peptidase SppA [Aggregicoccus sp. 17bor-14]
MRLIAVLLVNLWLLLRALVAAPFRLMRARRRPTWVRFRVAGDPPYRVPRKRRWRPGQRTPEPATVLSLDSLREALERLARDPALKGILLELEGAHLPPAKRDALAQLLATFRAAGKRVVGWAVSVDNAGYELLCACDEVLLAPAGRVDLLGFAAEATALGEGLGRLGIQAHFVRRGDYKTAPELFTHAEVSDIQRQTLEGFLDERYAALVDAVVRGRRRTPEQVRALVDEGPYSARRALGAGLVDALCSEADLGARLLGEGTKDDEARGVESYAAYLAHLPWPPVRWRPLRLPPRLALVSVSGMIVSGKGTRGVGPQAAGSEAVVKAVRAAARDPRSRALLLYIDSPGGSALASELILEAVQRAGQRKPIIAFVDRVAASGGYMAALGARELWSAPHAIVGSIGVFAGKFDASALLERLGIGRTLITRGENAGLHSSSRGFTPHERASLEAEVEETYQAFLGMVAQARRTTPEQVHQRAEGRVYSGTRALEAGLVDRVGGFEDACRRALELAEVAPGPFELAHFGAREQPLSLLRLLAGAARAQLYALCPLALGVVGLGDLPAQERFD